MQSTKEKYEVEQRELKACLSRANNEILKLAHSLSVRGMIERLECQYSDKRRRGDGSVSRKAVWLEILGENAHIRKAVVAACSGRNEASKVSMAVEAIVEIYRRTSDEIHHAGYDEIPVFVKQYHGQELSVLRSLCTAANYLIKEME
jgi:hypothetical protein